jgi:hypothetical protein
MFENSKLNSEYIREALLKENRSVWIAQREGRTKDGMDLTQKGMLKMLALASEVTPLKDYFKQLKIVPVSISYENDPTDVLKMPELLAKAREEIYVKQKNEDFKTLVSGIMGQKKRIHISVGKVLDEEIDEVLGTEGPINKQLQLLAEELDRVIVHNYQLWPTNYIALDIMNNTSKYAAHYTNEEMEAFKERMHKGIDMENEVAVHNFLAMYANPVVHKQNISQPTS